MKKKSMKKERKENAGLKHRYEENPGRVVASTATKSRSVLREDCFRIMNEDNTVDAKNEPKLDKALMLGMYRNMVLTRLFDERGMMLQRQGRIGFYVPSFGQEAIQTGTAAALTLTDWVYPSYREPGIFLYRGVTPYLMFCNLWGNAADTSKGRQMPVHYSYPEQRLFSVSSPISTQIVQAVGSAMAFKLRGEKGIAITYCGDGGTSENDFHTGLTFAGAYQAPTVFVVTNNQYAISCPISKQTGAKRFVDKAEGYGMPGVAVDGNDILAVYQATMEAVERARKGGGPSLIEAVTLRMGPHSSSDDPTRYRDEKLFQAWQKRDPIQRFRQYLTKKKLWDDDKEKELTEKIKGELAAAVEEAERQPPPDLDTLFSDVYSELTPQLERQKESLTREKELRGKFEYSGEAFPL